jgi:bifunctional DNA-binding transcriptional regulator/antitoxin component of YhaV-PrlF toxin-antitoxin module
MQLHHKRPSEGTLTGRVWQIAERISHETGRVAQRKQVMDAFAKEGGNPNTASTQYALWKDTFDGSHLKPVEREVHDVGPVKLQIGRDGRVLLPAEIRGALRLNDSGTVTAEVKDGVLTLLSPLTAVRKLQHLIKTTDQSTASVVDELIAERRLEASVE